VDPGDDCVRGHNETVARLAVEERRIVEKFEPTRPRKRCEEAPNPFEFSKLSPSHA